MVLQVPNGMGSALGAIQLLLYFIYRDTKPPSNQDSIEMGTTKPQNQNP